jgi:hypothetical protein
MTTTSLFQSASRAAFAVACMLHPASASATAWQPGITDHPLEQRMVITLAAVTPGTDMVQRERLPRSGMLYRIRVELAEQAVPSNAEWSLVVAGTSAGLAARLTRLGTDVRELVLPRPLGFGVHAGDSISVHVRLAAGAAQPLVLRVVLEYEAAPSRLAVAPVQALPIDQTDAGSTRSWALEAPVSARVLTLSGLVLVGAGELILHDVETGDVVWRETVQPCSGEGFVGAAGVVRGGFALHAGRTYRLSAVPAADGTRVVADAQTVVEILLLPARALVATRATR